MLVPARDDGGVSPVHRHMGRAGGGLLHATEITVLVRRRIYGSVASCHWILRVRKYRMYVSTSCASQRYAHEQWVSFALTE